MHPDAAADRPTVLLISGYGRSGSTVVEIETCRRTGALGIGELKLAVRQRERGRRRCSCGAPIDACPFWDSLARRALLDEPHVAGHESPFSALARRGNRDAAPRALFEALAEAAAPRRLIVDSSKTPWGSLARPTRLLRALGDGFDVVHLGLFREPIGIYRSMRKGRNEDLAVGAEDPDANNRHVGARLVLGWWAANLAVAAHHLLFRLRGRPSVVRELADLGDRFDLIEALGLPRDRAGPMLHMAGGNRLLTDAATVRLAPTPRRSDGPVALRALTFPMLALLRRLARRPDSDDRGRAPRATARPSAR